MLTVSKNGRRHLFGCTSLLRRSSAECHEDKRPHDHFPANMCAVSLAKRSAHAVPVWGGTAAKESVCLRCSCFGAFKLRIWMTYAAYLRSRTGPRGKLSICFGDWFQIFDSSWNLFSIIPGHPASPEGLAVSSEWPHVSDRWSPSALAPVHPDRNQTAASLNPQLPSGGCVGRTPSAIQRHRRALTLLGYCCVRCCSRCGAGSSGSPEFIKELERCVNNRCHQGKYLLIIHLTSALFWLNWFPVLRFWFELC